MAPGLTVPGVLGRGGRLARVIGAAYEARTRSWRWPRLSSTRFSTRTPLVVEAGTGTGKSLAYLAGELDGPRAWSSPPPPKPCKASCSPRTCRCSRAPWAACKSPPAKGKSNYLASRRPQDNLDVQHRAWPTGLPPGEMSTWATTTTTGDLNESPLPRPCSASERAGGDDCLKPALPVLPRLLVLPGQRQLAPCRCAGGEPRAAAHRPDHAAWTPGWRRRPAVAPGL